MREALTLFWCAAKCALTKQMVESMIWKRIATAPLLPCSSNAVKEVSKPEQPRADGKDPGDENPKPAIACPTRTQTRTYAVSEDADADVVELHVADAAEGALLHVNAQRQAHKVLAAHLDVLPLEGLLDFVLESHTT